MSITVTKKHIGTEMIKVSASVVQSSGTTITLDQEPLFVQSVRVTTGSSPGLYCVTDAAGAVVDVGLQVGVCSLDGKVLTFNSAFTTATVVYVCAAGELR
jgi:hypothetical protein